MLARAATLLLLGVASSLAAPAAGQTPDVEALLTTARARIEQRKLTLPQGENAHEALVRVLEVDPDNHEARALLETIKSTYLRWARGAEAQARLEQAVHYCRRCLVVDPSDTTCRDMLRSLELRSPDLGTGDPQRTQDGGAMVLIPQGVFMMGSDEAHPPDRRPRHAVELARRHEIDVLLTDVRPPGIDGIEVVRRALKIRPSVKVVVMTAFGSPAMRRLAERQGALEYIEKPLKPDNLHRVMRRAARDVKRVSHEVGGLDVYDVTQFLATTGQGKVVSFRRGEHSGVLVFDNGQLINVSAGDLVGIEAFREMASWGEGSFQEIFATGTRRYSRNINVSTTELLEHAFEAGDTAHRSDDVFPLHEATRSTGDGDEPPVDRHLTERVAGGSRQAFAEIGRVLGREPAVEAWCAVSEHGNTLAGRTAGSVHLPALATHMHVHSVRAGPRAGLGAVRSVTAWMADGRVLCVLPRAGHLLAILVGEDCDVDRLCARVSEAPA